MKANEISEIEEEKLWLDSITKNPAFDYLMEPEEDIYSPKVRKPLDNN